MDSIYKTDLEARVIELCDRVLATQGYRAVDVECLLAGRSVIRVFVDSKEPHEGSQITLEECSKISRFLGPVFEAESVLEGRYDLEISSPGMDRRLRLKEDFVQHIGQWVRLRLVEKTFGLGDRPWGKLTGLSNGQVQLEVDGREVDLPLANIKRANLIWDIREDRV